MPDVRTRTLVLVIAVGLAAATGGCASPGAAGSASWHAPGEAAVDASAQPVASTPTGVPPGASDGPSASASTVPSGPPSPSTSRGSASAASTGSVARVCRMVDLRFWLSLATPAAGPYASGSVQMTNIATDRCRVSGYITVRWLDGAGAQMPIAVEHRPGSMPGYTSVLVPGKSAFAGLSWTRSRALPSDPDILCPPAPAAIEARLAAETTFARMTWTPGEGLCDAKAGLEPVEMIH